MAFICGEQTFNVGVEALVVNCRKDTRRTPGLCEVRRMDTGATVTSIISRGQYASYCDTFGVLGAIKRAHGRTVRGICGRQAPQGMVNIQITFRNFRLIIDVEFLVLGFNVPMLLSMQDIIKNNFYISIKDSCIKF